MFLLSNSSLFLHPAITVHLMTPPALPEQGKVQLLSISCKFPSGSPVYLPRVEVNLVVVPCYSKPERGDGVLTAVYLWGRGVGGGSQWGYNSSAVCGGLAKHVLDHTALFLRGLRSCDSAFLFSAWPLDTFNACNTHAHTHKLIYTRNTTHAGRRHWREMRQFLSCMKKRKKMLLGQKPPGSHLGYSGQ